MHFLTCVRAWGLPQYEGAARYLSTDRYTTGDFEVLLPINRESPQDERFDTLLWCKLSVLLTLHPELQGRVYGSISSQETGRQLYESIINTLLNPREFHTQRHNMWAELQDIKAANFQTKLLGKTVDIGTRYTTFVAAIKGVSELFVPFMKYIKLWPTEENYEALEMATIHWSEGSSEKRREALARGVGDDRALMAHGVTEAPNNWDSLVRVDDVAVHSLQSRVDELNVTLNSLAGERGRFYEERTKRGGRRKRRKSRGDVLMDITPALTDSILGSEQQQGEIIPKPVAMKPTAGKLMLGLTLGSSGRAPISLSVAGDASTLGISGRDSISSLSDESSTEGKARAHYAILDKTPARKSREPTGKSRNDNEDPSRKKAVDAKNPARESHKPTRKSRNHDKAPVRHKAGAKTPARKSREPTRKSRNQQVSSTTLIEEHRDSSVATALEAQVPVRHKAGAKTPARKSREPTRKSRNQQVSSTTSPEEHKVSSIALTEEHRDSYAASALVLGGDETVTTTVHKPLTGKAEEDKAPVEADFVNKKIAPTSKKTRNDIASPQPSSLSRHQQKREKMVSRERVHMIMDGTPAPPESNNLDPDQKQGEMGIMTNEVTMDEPCVARTPYRVSAVDQSHQPPDAVRTEASVVEEQSRELVSAVGQSHQPPDAVGTEVSAAEKSHGPVSAVQQSHVPPDAVRNKASAVDQPYEPMSTVGQTYEYPDAVRGEASTTEQTWMIATTPTGLTTPTASVSTDDAPGVDKLGYIMSTSDALRVDKLANSAKSDKLYIAQEKQYQEEQSQEEQPQEEKVVGNADCVTQQERTREKQMTANAEGVAREKQPQGEPTQAERRLEYREQEGHDPPREQPRGEQDQEPQGGDPPEKNSRNNADNEVQDFADPRLDSKERKEQAHKERAQEEKRKEQQAYKKEAQEERPQGGQSQRKQARRKQAQEEPESNPQCAPDDGDDSSDSNAEADDDKPPPCMVWECGAMNEERHPETSCCGDELLGVYAAETRQEECQA
jgi:hypothetical protein